MKKRKIALLVLLLVTLSLFFYWITTQPILYRSFTGGWIYDNSDRIVDARVKRLLTAIRKQDIDALLSEFSNRAKSEADDLRGSIEELFNILEGSAVSAERDGYSADTKMQRGKQSQMIRYSIDLKTEHRDYRFFVIDYIIDTIDQDNEGLYMLELIIYTDSADLTYWQNRMRPGIYIH